MESSDSQDARNEPLDAGATSDASVLPVDAHICLLRRQHLETPLPRQIAQLLDRDDMRVQEGILGWYIGQ